MADQVVGIQPKMLRWARVKAGYSVEEVATKLQRDPVEVVKWEIGEAAPTYAQLEKLAYDLYKRPLALFFLSEPPQEAEVKKEFRTLPDTEIDQLLPNTRYLLRLGRAFQLSLKELSGDTNLAEHKIFKEIRLTDFSHIPRIARNIRERLGVNLDVQLSWNSADEALKAWRDAVEEAGVFVFKQSFKQKTISGFCLMDSEFPVILLTMEQLKIGPFSHQPAEIRAMTAPTL